MITAHRSKENPLFFPNRNNPWEAEAAFNGSVVKTGSTYFMLYRALSLEHLHEGKRMQVSSIGVCQGGDGLHFRRRRQLVVPDQPWDQYGCEDPRVTYMDGKYYIFYTAISAWPPGPDTIKVAVAISEDLETITEKHLVTPFNAKATVLFPEKVNGKFAAVVTANTDKPPSKIAYVEFDQIEQLWDENFWNAWYEDIASHVIPIAHTTSDHLEVGAVPVKIDGGWVLVFCYIENYFKGTPVFRVDAALLESDNPQHLIGQTLDPLLVPEEPYELYGMVPNIIFPTSAISEEGQLYIYYSSCDTSICRAGFTVTDLLEELKNNPSINPQHRKPELMVRFDGNPIISPRADHAWESKYTFNAGAVYAGEKVHIFYRAMGDDDTSVLGYASSKDGLHIDERLDMPVYLPRESFESKFHPGFSGCEDPRLTCIGDTIHMCYTAYDGVSPPRIALSTIKVDDLLAKNWSAWSQPKLISAPGIDNKDSCIVSEKINDQYIVFHRLPPCIWIDMVTDLEFGDNRWLGGHPLMGPRVNSWDSLKIGLNGPPEKTEDGWLLLYHGVSKTDDKYRMGAVLLDLDNPLKILARLKNPIMEPLTWYENEGYRAGTIFSNGQVIKDGVLYVYYGGADKYLGVATCSVKDILTELKGQ